MKADLVINGAHIFQGLNLPNSNDYIAIKGNKIVDIGLGKAPNHYYNKNTKVINLNKNNLLLPGFFDSHVHLVMAGMYISCVNLSDAKSEEEAAKLVAEYAKTIPDDQWVLGFGWYHLFWNEQILPTKKSLDKYIPDRPVFLLNAEVHGAWVNSKALEISGITSQTLNPPYGEILKDRDGMPTGFLNESALGLAAQRAYKFNEKQEMKYVKIYLEQAKKYGITAFNDMLPRIIK